MDTAALPPKTKKLLDTVKAQLVAKDYPSPEPAVLLDIIISDITPEDVVEDFIEFLNANDPEDHPRYQREFPF